MKKRILHCAILIHLLLVASQDLDIHRQEAQHLFRQAWMIRTPVEG